MCQGAGDQLAAFEDNATEADAGMANDGMDVGASTYRLDTSQALWSGSQGVLTRSMEQVGAVSPDSLSTMHHAHAAGLLFGAASTRIIYVGAAAF